MGVSDLDIQSQDGAGDQGDTVDDETLNGVMFQDQFQPGAMFVVVSPVVDWSPDVPEVRALDPFEYNTRVIRYLNSDDVRILFLSQEASLPPYGSNGGYVVDDDEESPQGEVPQPEVYQMGRRAPFVDGTDHLIRRVNFSPLREEVEDRILEIEDWWRDRGRGNS